MSDAPRWARLWLGAAAIYNLLALRYTETAARLSPDGKLLAYQSDEAGQLHIFVVDFPAAKRKWQVSKTTAGFATWSADGRQLYLSGPDHISVVDVTGGDAEKFATPEIVVDRSDSRFRDLLGGPLAVVGKRFLALRYTSKIVPEPLRIIQNWQAVIRR